MTVGRARIGRFRLRAFRSCKDTRFSPTERVTALIGPNGSGKTNVMHGMLLLQLQTRGRRYKDDDDPYSVKSYVDIDFIYKKKKIQYRAQINYGSTQLGQEDVATSNARWNFKELTGKAEWLKDEEIRLSLASGALKYNLHLADHGPVYYYSSRRRAKLSHLALDDSNLEPIPKEISNAYIAIQKLRSGIKYYSASQFTNPSLCPTAFDIDEDGDLIPEGPSARRGPHTRFMFDLYKLYQTNSPSYQAFLSLIDKKGMGLIDKIRWRAVKFSSSVYDVRAGGKVIPKKRIRTKIIPTLQIGSSQLSFSQLSEGTLRSLAMIFYIITDKSLLLLLEEPEVCVHHGLLKSVVSIIKEYSKSKQIIISTHSESVIDSLQPEEVLIVDKSRYRGTTVKPISDTMSSAGYRGLKHYLSTVGALGEFWKNSGFEQ